MGWYMERLLGPGMVSELALIQICAMGHCNALFFLADLMWRLEILPELHFPTQLGA